MLASLSWLYPSWPKKENHFTAKLRGSLLQFNTKLESKPVKCDSLFLAVAEISKREALWLLWSFLNVFHSGLHSCDLAIKAPLGMCPKCLHTASCPIFNPFDPLGSRKKQRCIVLEENLEIDFYPLVRMIISFWLFIAYIHMPLITEIPRSRMVDRILMAQFNLIVLHHSRSTKWLSLSYPFNRQLLHFSQASSCSHFREEKKGTWPGLTYAPAISG